AVGQGAAIYRKRVVARDGVRRGQARKYIAAGVRDGGGLPVHDGAGPYDVATVGGAYGLMAQANTQYRQLAAKMEDGGYGNTGGGRRARAGRDTDTVGLEAFDVSEGDLVV